MGRTRAGNTGANKQPGLLSVRSALARSGAQVRGEGGREEKGGGGGGGTTRSRGIELRGRSYAGVFSHSVRTGVICALGWLSPETRPRSAVLLMAYLSKPLSIELFNMTRYAEGNYLSLL